MLTGEKKEAIRVRLAELEAAAGGLLTPDAVVADAKDPSSPLHDSFEWDVSKAAHAHWLDQARTLITSVRVSMQVDHTIVRSVYYVRDPARAGTEQGYVNVRRLRSDTDAARDALISECRRAGDVWRRVEELAKALDLQHEVASIVAGISALERLALAPPATAMPRTSIGAEAH